MPGEVGGWGRGVWGWVVEAGCETSQALTQELLPWRSLTEGVRSPEASLVLQRSTAVPESFPNWSPVM